jgi:hypothetical protein
LNQKSFPGERSLPWRPAEENEVRRVSVTFASAFLPAKRSCSVASSPLSSYTSFGDVRLENAKVALPPGIGVKPDIEPLKVRAVGRVVCAVLEGGVGGTAIAKILMRA